jgi:segregation and condensation protein B
MVENYSSSTKLSLISKIEVLLFIAPGLTSVTQLAETLNVNPSEIEYGLEQLKNCYEQDRGLRLIWHSGKVELTTKPEMSEMIEKFLGLDTTSKLSKAGLETLTIIAYRQPITRPTIDSIRGVNSDGVIKSLLSKGLITEFDRANTPGRPILFGTTEDFLLHFGLGSIEELPAYISDEQQNKDIQNGIQILKD